MLKKALLGLVAVSLLTVVALFFFAQTILAQDSVRAAIASQLAGAIGQPVAIGSIGASVFPRVTVSLGDVAIGEPARMQVRTLAVGTNLRALFSRRIENGSLRLTGARVELPLPPLGSIGQATPEPSEGGGLPVTIVSIDEIVLEDVEIVSGGRTLRGDIRAVMQDQGVVIERVTLTADDTAIEASGRLTDLAAPAGELNIKAGALNMDRLLAFAADFSQGAGAGSSSGTQPAAPGAARPAGAGTMDIAVTIEAEKATMGALGIQNLSSRGRITADRIAVEPLSFGLFGGRYEGTLSVALGGDTPAFRWNAALSGIDVGAATTFAGSPDTITGTLGAKIDLSGTGADAATAIRTARGTARVDMTDGIVRKLGLIRGIVVATSGRSGAFQKASGSSSDEPFTRLGATMQIANGAAATDDLRFESPDLLLDAAGTVRLDGSMVNLAGRVQLSDALSKEAGSDLVRYSSQDGRVTLPVKVSGPASGLSVQIDVADAARRAITNRANEEVQKRLKGGLQGLFGKP
jgi:uncharacterized protein involved in outer membrane biogenesis